MFGIGDRELLGDCVVIYLVARRLILGPRRKACSPLFAIAFLLIGMVLFGLGLIGEYVGRIYQQVRGRPRYIVAAVLESQKGRQRERLRV